MKAEFFNRQAMNRTVLSVLDQPAHKAVWENQPPVIFTTKVAAFRTLVGTLEDLLREQANLLTGAAERKDREETEVEDKAHEVGQALATYFEDAGREDAAAEVDFSRSHWQRLRDEALLQRARLVLDRLRAALAADAAGLAAYGLAAAEATELEKEIADYAGVIQAPSTAIAGRKALTAALRPRFRQASGLLRGLDKLVLRFRRTEAGRAFADAWEAARVVRDLGAGPGGEPAPNPAPQP